MYASFSNLGVSEDNTDQYKVPEIRTLEEKNDLISTHEIVCVNVYADWCGPCKTTAPDFASNIFSKFNAPGFCAVVKENHGLKLPNQDFTIAGLPTYFVYHRGRLAESIVGADIKKLGNVLQQYTEGRTNDNVNNIGGRTDRTSIRNYR